MNYVLFPHAGSGNHGCEAIVRTTKEMLESDSITLFSNNVEEDLLYLGEGYIDVKSPVKAISKASLGYFKAAFKQKAGDSEAFDKLAFSPVLDMCGKETVLLSIGGDNYCYGDNRHIYLVNRQAKEKGAKLVLWGCSVEPDDISEEMAKDLASYDLITAREEETFDALKKINDNTVLVTDPAFVLGKSDAEYPDGLKDKKYIGLNLSPMVEGLEKSAGMARANFKNIINYIIKNTDYNIAFIPHVVCKGNDDRESMSALYDEYKQSGRVFMVKDQNCEQLKDIISGCEFFIGARTHATIAAYSTCVPTLVLGYSVKARGIAKAIFGTDKNYVIPVQSLKNDDELLNAFLPLFEKRGDIRKQLEKIMSDYISKAYIAKDELK